MAMTVLNNTSAMMTLGELNKNINRVGKDLKKVSTGTKITSAQDDASGYAISERMRVMMRSLDQDEQNVKNGRFLLNVAAGGIDNIVQELRSLKELALNSANDHNTDADRATIQKEFDQRMANIDDIASETNYNNKALLDGTYVRPKTDPKDVALPFVYQSIMRNVAEPSGTPIAVTNSPINADGVYEIPNGFTGTIRINAANVKLMQATPGATLSNVQIVGPSSGNANLWIEDLNITSSNPASVIQFQGGNNVLTIRGDNSLTTSVSDYAVINVGGGLNVQGNNTGSLTINGNNGGAGIGSNGRETLAGNIGVVNATVNVNSFATGHTGAAIGSGVYGASVGDITIENSTLSLINQDSFHACIGSGAGSSSAGNITVVNSNVTSNSIDTGIGSGYSGSTCGNIIISGSNLDIYNRDSACVGAGDAGGRCGDIYISGTVLNGNSEHGAGIGSGRAAFAGNITIANQSRITHIARDYGGTPDGRGDGAAVGTGLMGHVGRITISRDSLNLLDASEAYTAIGPGRGGSASDIKDIIVWPEPGHPLVIHHGTKANQSMNVYINDMHIKAMGLDAIDAALDYALEEATYVGSYISRLEYTEENIVTANENTQASESTIRDADMAKEMMSYTKNNVLAQASQSMLAQANQTASSVLSLLQ